MGGAIFHSVYLAYCAEGLGASGLLESDWVTWALTSLSELSKDELVAEWAIRRWGQLEEVGRWLCACEECVLSQPLPLWLFPLPFLAAVL